MPTDLLTVVQCWDDGVTADVRLTEILRRHDAKATFNLNAGLHETHRKPHWIYQGTEVVRLGWDEMRDVYAGFAIANHSLTHACLDEMTEQAARREIVEGKDRLEQFFGQRVPGFVYPFGRYNDSVKNAVREAGHVYARTADTSDRPFPPHDAMALHPSCHFLAPDFRARYEAARPGGVFYFWGHAYEMTTEAMWTAFEETIAGISADPAARWGIVSELFER